MTAEVKKHSILIVDDEVDLCELVAEFFEDAGFKVQKAYSGNQAITLLQSTSFDIVLSDIKMPNGNGIDLLKYIKNNAGNKSIVIMTTGFADISEAEVVALGAKCIIRKPLDPTELIQSILKMV